MARKQRVSASDWALPIPLCPVRIPWTWPHHHSLRTAVTTVKGLAKFLKLLSQAGPKPKSSTDTLIGVQGAHVPQGTWVEVEQA